MTLENRISKLEERRGKPIEPEDMKNLTPSEQYLAMLHPRRKSSGHCSALNKPVISKSTLTITPEEAYRRMIERPPTNRR